MEEWALTHTPPLLHSFLLSPLIRPAQRRSHDGDCRQTRDDRPRALKRLDEDFRILSSLRIGRNRGARQAKIVQRAQKQHTADGDSHGVGNVSRRQR